MAQLLLLAVELALLLVLVLAYRRLHRALAQVSASSSDLADPATDEPMRLTGVLRGRALPAMFAVVEIDRGALWVRSRPRFLGLSMAVARVDVADVVLELPRRGKVPSVVFQPVEGRADGLSCFRFQPRGGRTELTRGLRRLGWPVPASNARGAGRARRVPRGATG